MADNKTQELGTKFTADTKDLSEGVKRFLKLLEDLEQANKRVAASSASSMKDFASSIDSVSSKVQKETSEFNQLTGAINKATTATQKHDQTQEALGKRLGHISGFLDQVKSAFKVTSAYGIAATAIYTMINSMRAGTKEIVDFDQELHNLEAITGATSSQISAMSDIIKQVAHDTKYSTTEVAQGMVLIGQAGFKAAEVMNAIGPASLLATGTLSNMQTTTDLLTTALRAFNLNAIESSRVSDIMANAVNKSKLTIDKLRTAFNYVGASAHQVGLSLEETAASMMVLANSGIRASTIGTGLRQMLARLLAPNRALREAFEENNISLQKVNPRLVGYQTAIKNLIPVLYDYQKGTIDMSKAYELFGLRGAQAAAVIAQSFIGGDFQTALNKTYEVGTAAAMAETQAEGLGVMWKNLMDRAKLLAVALGELGLSGVFRGLIDFMRGVVDLSVSLVKSFGELTGHAKYLESELGKQVSRYQQAVASLTAYQAAFNSLTKEMKEGRDVSERYGALVQRFIKDHPELAKQINITTDSYKNMGEALKTINKEIEKSAMSAILKQAELLNKLNSDLINIAPVATETELKRAKINIKKAQEELEKMIFDIGNRQKWGPDRYNYLFKALGLSDEDLKKVKDNVSKLNDILSKSKAAFDPSQFQKELKKWPKAIEDFYNSLDPDKRGDFLTAFKKYKARLAEIKKTAQQTGQELTDQDFKVEEDKFLNDFKNKLSKEKTELLKLEQDYYALKSKFALEYDEKIEEERQRELTRIKTYLEKRIAYIRQYGGDEQKARDKASDLEIEANKYYDQKKLDSDLKLSKQRMALDKQLAQIQAEETKAEAVDSLKSKDDIKRRQEELDIAYLKKAVTTQKDYWDKVKAIWGEGSKQALKAESDYQNAVLQLKTAETNADTREAARRIQIKIKELNDRLKYVKKYSAEYMQILAQIRELEGRPLTDDEKIENRLRFSGNWLDGIRLSLRKFEKEHKTTTERISEVWDETFDSIGSSFDTFLNDSIENRMKSAADYVKGLLLDVAHAINNQLAQFAAVGLQSWVSGLLMPSYSGVGTYGVKPGGINWHDKGGWITEPVIGRGLYTGELHGIAENHPEYISPDGKMGGDNYTLQTEINVSVQGQGNNPGNAQQLGDMIATQVKGEFNKYLIDNFRPGGLFNQRPRSH